MVPRRDCFMSRPESTRCSINWSVHQYQKPIMADPRITPVHGKSGSLGDRIRLVIESPWIVTLALQISIISFQPPTLMRPNPRTAMEPTSKIGVCKTDVYSTAFIPPNVV